METEKKVSVVVVASEADKRKELSTYQRNERTKRVSVSAESEKNGAGASRKRRGTPTIHSLFRELPESQLTPLALNNDPKEIVALRAHVPGLGGRVIVRGRERASLPIIREHLRQHGLEREHARTRRTTIFFGPPPHIIRHAEKRRVRPCAFRAGQV